MGAREALIECDACRMPEMTVRSSTRGLPGPPRGRCGLSAFQTSSDSQATMKREKSSSTVER